MQRSALLHELGNAASTAQLHKVGDLWVTQYFLLCQGNGPFRVAHPPEIYDGIYLSVVHGVRWWSLDHGGGAGQSIAGYKESICSSTSTTLVVSNVPNGSSLNAARSRRICPIVASLHVRVFRKQA